MTKTGMCSQCGTQGTAKKVTRGSFLVELALWFCLLVPGLIYSLWRISTRRLACRTCGACESMVPLSSPRGEQLATEFARKEPPAARKPKKTGNPWTD